MLLTIKQIEAKYQITKSSLKNWEKQGLLHPVRTPGGHRRYLQQELDTLLGVTTRTEPAVAIYARVSTAKQKDNLARQIQRLKEYCEKEQLDNIEVFSDIASGLNDKRKQLKKMLDKVVRNEINMIVVEYPDRLARFGLGILIRLLGGFGCEVRIVEQAKIDTNEKLVEDILRIITFFSARVYGARGSKNRKQDK